MLKTIYRFENSDGRGPFTYPDFKKWESTAEHNKFAREFARQLGWLKTIKRSMDPFEALFGFSGPDDGNDDGYAIWKAGGDHPHHEQDVPFPDDDRHNWKIGCKDMDQLKHWFPETAWGYLGTLGFELVTYECDCEHIHFGTFQLLFCIDHVKEVSRVRV